MTKEQLIAELEVLEGRLRKAAESNESHARDSEGVAALVYGGQANGYEQSAHMLADLIRYAKIGG